MRDTGSRSAPLSSEACAIRRAPSADVSVSRGAAKAHEGGRIFAAGDWCRPFLGVVTWQSGASRYNARCVLGDLPPRYNVLAPEAVRVGADPGPPPAARIRCALVAQRVRVAFRYRMTSRTLVT
jgi:hypothetical protein